MHKMRFLFPAVPVGVGGLTLIGWVLNLDILQRGGISSAVAMNPATAVGFILLGLEVLRLYAGKDHVTISGIGQFVVGVVIIASAMKLSDLALGTSFFIDQRLFATKLNIDLSHPNRMAPNTALCFFFLGLSLQVMRSRKKSSVALSQGLAALSALVALLAIVGYLYGVKSLYGMGVLFPMSVDTAIAFILLSTAVLCTYPNQGYLRVFTNGGSAGEISSILLPATFIVPFLLGWVTLAAKRAGLLDDAFEQVLSTILDVTVFFILSYISVRTLFFSDLHRQKMLLELHSASMYARSLIEASLDPLMIISSEGKITDVNEGAVKVTGVPRNLLIGSDFSKYFTEPDKAHAGYEEAFAKGAVENYSLNIRHASGKETGVLCNASVYRNANGEVMGVAVKTRDITDLKRAEQAEDRASRDSLTRLYNHNTFYLLLDDEIVRSQRYNRPVSLLMLDIDHFKSINDTHGHQVGDVILKGLSDLLVQQARTIDRVCRYGGEEFMVILSETDATSAMNTAERLRTTAERQLFDIGGGKNVGITVSIGVATYPHQAKSSQELVKAADVALYAAKSAGRNRVCHYEDSAI